MRTTTVAVLRLIILLTLRSGCTCFFCGSSLGELCTPNAAATTDTAIDSTATAITITTTTTTTAAAATAVTTTNYCCYCYYCYYCYYYYYYYCYYHGYYYCYYYDRDDSFLYPSHATVGVQKILRVFFELT